MGKVSMQYRPWLGILFSLSPQAIHALHMSGKDAWMRATGDKMARQVNTILNSFLTFCLHGQLMLLVQWGPDMLPGYS